MPNKETESISYLSRNEIARVWRLWGGFIAVSMVAAFFSYRGAALNGSLLPNIGNAEFILYALILFIIGYLIILLLTAIHAVKHKNENLWKKRLPYGDLINDEEYNLSKFLQILYFIFILIMPMYFQVYFIKQLHDAGDGNVMIYCKDYLVKVSQCETFDSGEKTKRKNNKCEDTYNNWNKKCLNKKQEENVKMTIAMSDNKKSSGGYCLCNSADDSDSFGLYKYLSISVDKLPSKDIWYRYGDEDGSQSFLPIVIPVAILGLTLLLFLIYFFIELKYIRSSRLFLMLHFIFLVSYIIIALS